jgi:hypothetical protein
MVEPFLKQPWGRLNAEATSRSVVAIDVHDMGPGEPTTVIAI